MKYRTTCPHCASVFRLVPDQLEATAGWVQCGVCGIPFDAWPSLLQEDGTPLAFPAEPPPATPVPETIIPGEAPDAETPAIEAPSEVPTDETAASETLATADVPAAPPPPLGIAGRAHAEELPSIILVDPDHPADDEFGPLPVMPSQPSMPPVYPPLDRPSPSVAPLPESIPEPAPVAAAVSHDDAAAHLSGEWPDNDFESTTVPVARRRFAWAWAAASLLLLATFLGQAAYFLRDTLAAELPQTRPALEQACALLGCTLELPHQIGQLRIVGSDLQTEATERLRLTLTLGNRSAQAQAWPVLVLTLTDPQGQPLARRSFAPSEYLGDPARIAAGVPPRSEHPLSLPLSVRSLKATGFDLRLTY